MTLTDQSELRIRLTDQSQLINNEEDAGVLKIGRKHIMTIKLGLNLISRVTLFVQNSQ